MSSGAPRQALIGAWPVDHAPHETWPPGGALYHCYRYAWDSGEHRFKRDPDAFDPSEDATVRFSPIFYPGPPDPMSGDATRMVVPSWYAGSTRECAVAESLFHDIPMGGGEVIPARYEHRRVSRLRTTRPLTLLRLDTDGVRALGPNRWVYECEAIDYARTEALAQTLYDDHPAIDGLVWMSRRRNSDSAVVLYAHTGSQAHAGGIRPADLVADSLPLLNFDQDDDWEWLRRYGRSVRIDIL